MTDPADEAVMKADADFMKWLGEYCPDWESKYSGNLLAMHDAFLAGREAQRTDDLLNNDHE